VAGKKKLPRVASIPAVAMVFWAPRGLPPSSEMVFVPIPFWAVSLPTVWWLLDYVEEERRSNHALNKVESTAPFTF